MQLNNIVKDSNSVSKVIMTRGKCCLFLQKNTGEWELPGGHLHVGEKHKPGATREVFEETGIRIFKLKLVRKGRNFKLFHNQPTTTKVKLSKEHVNHAWIDRKSLNKIKLTKSTIKNIPHVLKFI